MDLGGHRRVRGPRERGKVQCDVRRGKEEGGGVALVGALWSHSLVCGSVPNDPSHAQARTGVVEGCPNPVMLMPP